MRLKLSNCMNCYTQKFENTELLDRRSSDLSLEQLCCIMYIHLSQVPMDSEYGTGPVGKNKNHGTVGRIA